MGAGKSFPQSAVLPLQATTLCKCIGHDAHPKIYADRMADLTRRVWCCYWYTRITPGQTTPPASVALWCPLPTGALCCWALLPLYRPTLYYRDYCLLFRPPASSPGTPRNGQQQAVSQLEECLPYGPLVGQLLLKEEMRLPLWVTSQSHTLNKLCIMCYISLSI